MAAEQAHAIKEWRRQFRGEAQVRDDTAITRRRYRVEQSGVVGRSGQQQGAGAHRREAAGALDEGCGGGGQASSIAAATHAPILIYPNPLNPKKYVVLNSGFTFREYDYLNNARQIPKLPDYAMVDTTTPPDERYPGKIVTAGFFGEKWELIQ